MTDGTVTVTIQRRHIWMTLSALLLALNLSVLNPSGSFFSKGKLWFFQNAWFNDFYHFSGDRYGHNPVDWNMMYFLASFIAAAAAGYLLRQIMACRWREKTLTAFLSPWAGGVLVGLLEFSCAFIGRDNPWEAFPLLAAARGIIPVLAGLAAGFLALLWRCPLSVRFWRPAKLPMIAGWIVSTLVGFVIFRDLPDYDRSARLWLPFLPLLPLLIGLAVSFVRFSHTTKKSFIGQGD